MNALGNAVRGIRNIWGHGDEDEDDLDAPTTSATPAPTQPVSSATTAYSATSYRPDKAPDKPFYGGGSSATRRPRAVPMALRRDKNIYTLKPKNLDESAIAADHLKTGSAVVLNLDDVDRLLATRIIDFMSGVCYGLESQGHAMKLGDTIFLFTPGEFEISSDETDYGENRDFFFKDAAPGELPAPPHNDPAQTSSHAGTVTSSVRITASDLARANAAQAANPGAPNVPPSLRDRAWET